VKAIINAQNKAAKIIFKKNNKPFRDISIKKNEKDFAFLISLLILETIVLGRLLKINPFNQPAVEEVKIETKKILQR
jgi:glucose-6-phosphate isomerase